MVRRIVLGSIAATIWAASAVAQGPAPSYEADPTVYKVIFEDQNFRVIVATWKKGTTDKPHSHPVPFVVYPLTACTIRLHNPDGTTRDTKNVPGTAFSGPIISSHTAENISDSDCQVLFVERK